MPGIEIDPATGAVVAPIHLSTTFERDVEGTYPRGFMYTRNDNPNRKALEEGVSLLEGGAAAAAFGSGMAAASGLLAPSHPVITFSPTSMPITAPADCCVISFCAGNWKRTSPT